ncbi:MAG: ABC transporter substrate-binding protein [Dehalococcoidales bacterium]|nr:ABC transporter substrate-binding protein [Dehalococcoidales bacterium]
MLKKGLWALISSLMILSLLLTSCSDDKDQADDSSTTENSEGTVVEDEMSSPDVPKYGGTFIYCQTMDVMGFDPILFLQMECGTLRLTNEELMQGNWAKGPAGTGETDWTSGFIGRVELETGCLAESWETPDNETIIYHIRKGIHYGLDTNSEASVYVNGREYTAADAAYSIDANFNTETAYSYMAYTRAGYGPTDIQVVDDYTVKVTVPEIMHGLMLLVMGDNMFQVCPDVTEKYGDQSDWKNQVGTGPYFLSDYVSSSTITYTKNPGYWKKDPLHPQNQLPYLDTIKSMIIPDLSTRLSALRTGKIDRLSEISWEDAEMLMDQAPDLESKAVVAGPTLLVMRVDKPELPYYDLRVRRAMNMAVNQQEIVDDYYNGNSAMFAVPYPPTPTYSQIFTPLEEQSQEVQELFTYNPAKAKELLAEAGYPDGFQTKINCSMAEADYVAMVREYLLGVDIDMVIEPLEDSVMRSVGRGRTHEEMITMVCVDYAFPFRLLMVRQESFDNRAFFEDPFTRDSYEKINAVVGKNDTEVNKLIKEVGKFSLAQAWGIWMPAPYQYTMWWPWVQNYHGEGTVGYDGQNQYNHFIWTDMDLKQSMGY